MTNISLIAVDDYESGRVRDQKSTASSGDSASHQRERPGKRQLSIRRSSHKVYGSKLERKTALYTLTVLIQDRLQPAKSFFQQILAIGTHTAAKVAIMSRKKILVVDDSKVEVAALSGRLASVGYDVAVAEDGSSALSTARRERPDLIILDVMYPPDVAHGGGVAWDGFLILNWLRRIEEARNTPVIFVTGLDKPDYKDRALKAGATAFFHKPYRIDDLLGTIHAHIEKKTAKPSEKKRLLFVDDEGDWRFVAGACLEDAGFEVVTAKDAAEAMKRMEKLHLDAIVLDLNLGGENGLLLLELLKLKHPGVPILIYTGQDLDKNQVQSMLNQGATKHLKKGAMGDLCNTLKAMVN
jgi:DNA-binding response OmpR family regulator